MSRCTGGRTMMKRLSTIALAACVLAAGLAGASIRTAARQAAAIDYATSVGSFGADRYVSVAMEKGYFEQAGFDVKVVPGTGSVDNIKLVAAGRIDYS